MLNNKIKKNILGDENNHPKEDRWMIFYERISIIDRQIWSFICCRDFPKGCDDNI